MSGQIVEQPSRHVRVGSNRGGADGDELVAAVADILSSLWSGVRDMDAERAPGTAKREDLRLTLGGRPGWEAIVEVKGYTKGTKTTATPARSGGERHPRRSVR